MSEDALCEIFYEFLEYFYKRFGCPLTEFRPELMSIRAEIYADAVKDAGAPLDSCVGFIDATNLYVARPKGAAQSATYNGHRRRNAFKMESVSTPDGLLFHMYGPEEGRRHDICFFTHSGVEEALSNNLLLNGRQLYIYGHAANVLRSYLQVAFPRLTATLAQASFNKEM